MFQNIYRRITILQMRIFQLGQTCDDFTQEELLKSDEFQIEFRQEIVFGIITQYSMV